MGRVLLSIARRYGFGQEEIVAPLGIMYIASVLREAGHKVLIFDPGRDWNKPECFKRALLAFRPEIVGLSSLAYDAPVLEGMAKVSKTTLPDVQVIVGGPYATSYPERCARQSAIDWVVIGEGEITALELVNALTRGGCDPRSVRGVASYDEQTGQVIFAHDRELIEDVNSIPFPAWDLVDFRLYCSSESHSGQGRRQHMVLFTSRGCPFRCIYCHEIHGKRFRARSPENVMLEMQYLRKYYGIEDFEFLDDVFNFDRERLLEFCSRMIAGNWRPKLHFPNGLRADLLDSAQIDRLHAAGTVSLDVAIETASPRLQKLIMKNLDVEKSAENIAIAVNCGIYTMAYFMLGFPTETYEEARQTVDWALRSRIHHGHFNITTAFAGTAIYEIFQSILLARGLKEDDVLQQCFQKPSINLSEMSDKQLFALQKEAYRRMLFDPYRALRIMAHHNAGFQLISKALVGLYYTFPLGRLKWGAEPELMWDKVPETLQDSPVGSSQLEPVRRLSSRHGRMVR